MRIILASGSPRRKEILQNLGVDFTVMVSDIDESAEYLSGDAMVTDLSYRKAKAVQDALAAKGEDVSHTLIIGADTAVLHHLSILGKPKNKKEAKEMLTTLINDTHFVITGLALLYGKQELVQTEMTKVTFDHLSPDVIDAYINTGEPMDKAGGYGIQGAAGCFVKKIQGDYLNVVGFPTRRFYLMLKEMGIPFPFHKD